MSGLRHNSQARMPAATAIALLGCVLTCAPASAETRSDPDGIPDDAAIETSGAVIGTIEVRNLDIFDTSREDEDRWAFRLANRLHIKTREQTILALLLFQRGDRYDRDLLDESERILREQEYLYDADIRPVRVRDGVVDVVVETRDVWTLKPTLNFKRAGGAFAHGGTGTVTTVRPVTTVEPASPTSGTGFRP